MGFNIAIDGPAGAGKTTVAKKLAEKLGFTYVDTGAMYRAVGLYCLKWKIPTNNHAYVAKMLNHINIVIDQDEGQQMVYLNGSNVTGEIRTSAVSKAASDVGTIPEVREKLVAMQKRMAEEADVVMEGRDTCNSVLPHAQVKIFLTATPDERAKRRYLELTDKNVSCTLEEVKNDLKERDYQDTHREISPLRQMPGTIQIDSTDMSIDDVVQMITELVECGGNKKCIE